MAPGPDNLDRILASEEELAPSSGFVASVMERVREEAAAPEPIAFPWKRVLPGAIIVGIGLAWCVAQLLWMGVAEAKAPVLVALHPSAGVGWRLEAAGWLAAALALSLLSWVLARRLAGSRGLI